MMETSLMCLFDLTPSTICLSCCLTPFPLSTYLQFRQYRVLRHKSAPRVLRPAVAQSVYLRGQSNVRERFCCTFLLQCFSLAVDTGALWLTQKSLIWRVAARTRHNPTAADVGRGIVVLVVIVLAKYLLSLPIDYYRAFSVEEWFGFNRLSPSKWIRDRVNGAISTVAISAPLIVCIFTLWSKSTRPLLASRSKSSRISLPLATLT